MAVVSSPSPPAPLLSRVSRLYALFFMEVKRKNFHRSRLRADFDHKPISQFLPTTNVIAVYVAHDQPIVDEAET